MRSVQDDCKPLMHSTPVVTLQEEVEIQDDDETEGGGDVFAAYYAEGSGDKQADRPVVFMPEIGLAMESLKGDFTIESLWSAM